MALLKENLWQKIITKNPHWLTDNVTLTPDGIKKLFNQTFDKGYELGVSISQPLEAQANRGSKEDSDAFDFLKTILK